MLTRNLSKLNKTALYRSFAGHMFHEEITNYSETFNKKETAFLSEFDVNRRALAPMD